MANKITYILGAGASAGTFPLVKGLKDVEKKSLADELIEQGERMVDDNIHTTNENALTMIEISKALIDTGANANEFGNVDSYAKYLYHTERIPQLNKLKLALTYYFVRQQICKECNSERNERRYLNLITSLINEHSKFPDHVKILNWNYDFLFQLAGMYYKPEKLVNPSDQNLSLPPFARYYPNYEAKTNNGEEYTLIHLNGIAGFTIEPKAQNKFPFHNIINDLLKNSLETQVSESELLVAFHEKYIKMDCLITFAWEIQSSYREHVTTIARTREIVSANIKGTNILVVIGYSFPFYNRETDNMIFKTLKKTLRKIYYQDPDPKKDGEFLRKRYDLPKEAVTLYKYEPKFSPQGSQEGIEIEHITDADQFYIPIEV